MTVFSSVRSMSELDFEEVKDYVGRQDLAHRLLEQSVREFAAECDERIATISGERDSLAAKVSQLEILLKGRQGALIAKEEECQRLRREARVSRPQLTLVQGAHVEISETVEGERKISNPWMSASLGVARFSCLPASAILSTTSFSTSASRSEKLDSAVQTVECSPMPSPARSPLFKRTQSSNSSPVQAVPATAFRRRSASSDEDSSPSGLPMRRRVGDSFASMRTSFGTVRSSVVESVSDDSDASLDELVSQAMRLSRSSFSSTGRNSQRLSGSSAVRTSTNSFPRRW